MDEKVAVIALGGNAILQPGQSGILKEQLRNVEITCRQLSEIVVNTDYQVIITHGNGPQVGNILLQNELTKDVVPSMPLDVCGAESQGLIGYMIQQKLHNILVKEYQLDVPIVTLLTQVIIDGNDPAFLNPTKPVGPFYTEEKAEQLRGEKGYTIIEDAGRGYRRVVPSPDPISIYEAKIIKQLVEKGVVVIAVGGGGIPVTRKNEILEGKEAVIDKDLATERLAEEIGAELFMILTDVDHVMLDYGKPSERAIGKISASQMKEYLNEDHFAEGSMKPKVQAAIRFIKAGGEKVVITSLKGALEALTGNTGTIITR